MIKIGTSKFEGIDWVQDHLGPVTPRNVAEDTYNSLISEGLIEWDPSTYEFVLVEDLNQDELRRRARNTMVTRDHRRIARKGPRSPRSMHQRPQHRLIHEHFTHHEHHHHDHQQHKMKQYQALPPDDMDSISTDNTPSKRPKKKK